LMRLSGYKLVGTVEVSRVARERDEASAGTPESSSYPTLKLLGTAIRYR
jgi:hypothetical protein